MTDQVEQELLSNIGEVLTKLENSVEQSTVARINGRTMSNRMIHANAITEIGDLIAQARKGYEPNHRVEGLLTDFAGEYAEPYAYMTNDKPPAVQAPMARRKVVEKYAAKLFTQADIDRAVEAGKLDALQKLNFDLIGLRDAENIKNTVSRHIGRAHGELRKLTPPTQH